MKSTAIEGTRADPDAGEFFVKLRRAHDPERPVLNTAEAATRLNMSRQAVVQAIQRGALDGYGIEGETRTRWWVFESAVAAREAEHHPEIQRLRDRNRILEDALATLTDAHDRRAAAEDELRMSRDLARESQARADNAWNLLNDAVRVVEAFVRRATVPNNIEDQ